MINNSNSSIRILVADDEENITDFIAYALERELYQVEKAYDGIETLKKYNTFKPDLIILDIMMPGYNGYEICKKLKEEQVGIIILTAKSDLMDRILGLDLGSDDYLTKPFEMIELLARVRSLARRVIVEKNNNKIILWGGLEIDLLSRIVFVDGTNIEFKPKEFDLLAFLIRNENIVFKREDILEKVWNMDYLGGSRTIDIHIQRIRKKLGKYGNIVVTVPTIGYKVVNCIE